MQSCVVIDYGSGNLRSVERALEAAARLAGVEARVIVSADPKAVRGADRIVLPGQGAFSDCMAGLKAIPDLVDELSEAVRGKGRPFLGICVGMQLLADVGLEHGERPGFCWVGGVTRPLDPGGGVLPHMGWNLVSPTRPHPVLDGLRQPDARGAHCYFAHSYILEPTEADDIAAHTEHGERFASAAARNNILGVQFHPEKSQKAGLDLLGRFLAWSP